MGSTMPSTIIVDPRPAPKPRNNILPRPFTTSERLHLGIIHNLDGPSERSLKIEADPTRPQVMRFRNDPAMEDRSRIADGDHVVLQSETSLRTWETIISGVSVGPESNCRCV